MEWTPQQHAERAEYYLLAAARMHDENTNPGPEGIAHLAMLGTLAQAHAALGARPAEPGIPPSSLESHPEAPPMTAVDYLPNSSPFDDPVPTREGDTGRLHRDAGS